MRYGIVEGIQHLMKLRTAIGMSERKYASKLAAPRKDMFTGIYQEVVQENS